MRILFNHGMTTAELYTNTPKKIIDRKWRWFIARYGSTPSYESAIADPFKYCIGLIMNKVIDDKVRFKIPVRAEAYIDFEVVSGEKFKEHRNNGRFKEIDFVNSDFTGYAIRYYFQAKAYQKSYQVYLGGDLKKKFLGKINSGENFYSIKDITINDFLEDVHKKFPELTFIEVKNLLLHGFRRLHSAMKYGCAITINTTKYINCYIYIGGITLTPEKQIKEYSIRRDRKLRKIEQWKKLDFDGYYFIGLNPVGLERWVELNKKSRTIVKFQNVIPRKIQKELYYKYKHVFIFKVKLKTFRGWSFWAEDLKIRDVEYIGQSYNHKFTESDWTWKELIKKYEE